MPSNSRYNCVIPVEEEQDDKEKENHCQINDFLHLLEKLTKKARVEHEDVQKIQFIFKNNKRLLNYQHCKDNKLRSVLHITKYNNKLQCDLKQAIVNTIVDMGYKLFAFSESNSIEDNCHALFFTAAKSDYSTLERIVEHLKTKNESKLHDTREGDTVLSFMIKFGDYAEGDFMECFEYLLKQNIDCRRIDYFKNSIEDVIKKERIFLLRVGNSNGIDKLNEIQNVIARINVPERNYGILYNKYQLFRSLILNDENFPDILTQNLALIDTDDGENTLLQLAVIKNNTEITKQLLEKGANPNLVVNQRNEDVPLILAAKLNRERIFQNILENERLEVTNNIFVKFITEIKPRFLNYLLESHALDVEYHYKGRTPLYYAIIRKNKKAIQSLLQRGAKLVDNCLNNINPKDLEEYLNSCIKFDSFKDSMEETDYKAFLVFDFFIKPTDGGEEGDNEDSEYLVVNSKPNSEIDNILSIGSNKRLEHLLEHPLIYTYILLKWYCVLSYYYYFVLLKFFFYSFIVYVAYLNFLNPYVLSLVLMVQSLIVYFNISEFKFEYRRYTLHFILEILLFLLLLVIFVLVLVDKNGTLNVINQISAFVIIFTSCSILLTLGYHINLSKWMAMAKRVFKNFAILLLFFTFPILAFAIAFNLLLSNQEEELPKKGNNASEENEDFTNLPRSIFRTLVMLSGDIGDKKFSLLGGYVLFLFFAVGMAIILLNFWTGVAVSDIKEIEEQSTVVAFNNVIVFIEGVEKIYRLFLCALLRKLPPRFRGFILANLPPPFLKSKVKVKRKKKSKVHYGVDLYINDEYQFKNNKHFKYVKLENIIISKIKCLYEEKDLSVGKILKMLVDKVAVIEDLQKRICAYENNFKKIEQLLECKECKEEVKGPEHLT